MTSDLEELAGFYMDEPYDEVRSACYGELRTVIARLQHQGVPAGTIIAALAFAVTRICAEQKRH